VGQGAGEEFIVTRNEYEKELERPSYELVLNHVNKNSSSRGRIAQRARL